jgi:hypothetical protein
VIALCRGCGAPIRGEAQAGGPRSCPVCGAAIVPGAHEALREAQSLCASTLARAARKSVQERLEAVCRRIGLPWSIASRMTFRDFSLVREMRAQDRHAV